MVGMGTMDIHKLLEIKQEKKDKQIDNNSKLTPKVGKLLEEKKSNQPTPKPHNIDYHVYDHLSTDSITEEGVPMLIQHTELSLLVGH
jgi:hypothetical protein